MTNRPDQPALGRLVQLEQRRAMRPSPKMGYQPSLDGLRGVSVVAVMLYHAGFTWMHGGFFGVEVFFVVSGFLITSLLIEERQATGAVVLRQFWLRRFRRLLPALFTMMVVVGAWAAVFGTARQQSDLARDYPWGILYVANWGQIVSDAPYFGNLSPFRHLWSLAVEEQWYLVWPLVFVAITKSRSGRPQRTTARTGLCIAAVAVAVMVITWWLARSTELTADRINFMYLSTITRSSGLLLGAGAAFAWRPWRAKAGSANGRAGTVLDVAGCLAVIVLLWQFATAQLTDRSVYRWQLPLVTLASLVVVLVVVHPSSRLVRSAFSTKPLVALGQRSYGLYLWSWPISVAVGAFTGSLPKFVIAMAITAVVSEGCYRFVETPVRKGAIGRWLAAPRSRDWNTVAVSAGIAALALGGPLVLKYTTVDSFDVAAGGADVSVDLGALQPGGSAATGSTSDPGSLGQTVSSSSPTDQAADSSTSGPPITAASLPRRLAIVGDSQAHALAVNLPDGTEQAFTVIDGSVEGCSVYDSGQATAPGRGSVRTFTNCAGWQDKWAKSVRQGDAQVALVVIGAWDVFDLEVDGAAVPFASAAFDQRFMASLQDGVDVLVGQGAKVALLEIACMRPVEAEGQGQAPLLQRGDDSRVAHLNQLMQQVAAANSTTTTFVSGPVQWCNDPAIAADLGYRWDGVHVYKPGAKLIIETIAPTVLAIPVPA